MNIIDIRNIESIIAYRERKEPELINGGDLVRSELLGYPTTTLKRLLEEYQNDIIIKIKELVDNIFKKYAEPEDNIIIIDGAWVPDRKTYEVEEPIRNIDFNGFGHKYNKLFYPIGSNWDLSSYYTQYQGDDDAKYDALCEESDNLRDLLLSIGVPTPEEYWENDNGALNEYWQGCIGIMKDYKIVSFIIRDDGMLCDEDGFESLHNHIIREL